MKLCDIFATLFSMSYLATLVYIYYVKGKLGKSLNNYKIASDKYNLLKSQLRSSNTNLFKLYLNILYNGNADIVASLYRQLNDLDKSNTVYYESLKTHLLNHGRMLAFAFICRGGLHQIIRDIDSKKLQLPI
jgi:hypothetical protein